MKEIDYFKTVITAVGALVSSALGVLAIPILLMVMCNVMDYVTGLMASPYRKEDINSYKSIKGIFKKVGMWILVVVGAVIDQLLVFTSPAVKMGETFSYLVASIVALWIVCSEIISILENLQDIGVAIPVFLHPLVKHIRSQVEEKGNIE